MELPCDQGCHQTVSGALYGRTGMDGPWLWKSVVASLSGMAANWLLMTFKYRLGLLPGFQPYVSLQSTLRQWIDSGVHPAVAWAFSLVNGLAIAGFVFACTYRLLPGQSGVVKGMVFGVLIWVMMGLLFFPAIGLGQFASQTGLGFAPVVFSLAMVLTYSVVMAMVYAALGR